MGIVRFAGKVYFADGWWLGIELTTPDGKHDGEVKGYRYFRCPKGHGAFVQARKAAVADTATVEAHHQQHQHHRRRLSAVGKGLFDAAHD